MTTPLALAKPLTIWQSLNAYVKHAVGVAAGIAISLGILDPATNEIHVNGAHSVYLVLIGTAASLVLSYAGLGAPAAPKTVYVGVLPSTLAAPAVLGQSGPLPAPAPATVDAPAVAVTP